MYTLYTPSAFQDDMYIGIGRSVNPTPALGKFTEKLGSTGLEFTHYFNNFLRSRPSTYARQGWCLEWPVDPHRST